ncbi:phage major capsid protein [Oryzobacter sp. R7]|uniref:phage major capsid protein n=1 Tax=Oryzobacter faecalis TaxID=3388656 RepID=UPI00398CFC23
MATLREQRAAAIKAAQDIIGKAQAAGRDLTTSERATLAQKNADVQALSSKIEQADADAKLFAAFDSPDGGEGRSIGALSFKGVADRILHGPDGGESRNVKSLIAAGSQAVATEATDITAVMGRPATSLMDAIPAREVAENFSYLRQTVRTNNAAPVAVGALKPTSIFTLERVEDRLRVIAHLSEPIPEYWLKDSTALDQFVRDEMVGGLQDAVIAQLIGGSGVGENLLGFANASGVQTQAWTVDAVETARRALGKVETLGMEGGAFVLNPTDWMSIETMRLSGGSGGFVMENAGAPIDRVRRQLWGVPVGLSTAVPVGVGYVVARDSVNLFTDGVVEVKWGLIGDDFGKNQVRCRAEGRFAAGTLRPAGVVVIDMTAA